MLGTRTGWSHREITALPRSVFDLYVHTLTNRTDTETNTTDTDD
jgi:hypothetical protein